MILHSNHTHDRGRKWSSVLPLRGATLIVRVEMLCRTKRTPSEPHHGDTHCEAVIVHSLRIVQKTSTQSSGKEVLKFWILLHSYTLKLRINIQRNHHKHFIITNNTAQQNITIQCNLQLLHHAYQNLNGGFLCCLQQQFWLWGANLLILPPYDYDSHAHCKCDKKFILFLL